MEDTAEFKSLVNELPLKDRKNYYIWIGVNRMLDAMGINNTDDIPNILEGEARIKYMLGKRIRDEIILKMSN